MEHSHNEEKETSRCIIAIRPSPSTAPAQQTLLDFPPASSRQHANYESRLGVRSSLLPKKLRRECGDLGGSELRLSVGVDVGWK